MSWLLIFSTFRCIFLNSCSGRLPERALDLGVLECLLVGGAWTLERKHAVLGDGGRFPWCGSEDISDLHIVGHVIK